MRTALLVAIPLALLVLAGCNGSCVIPPSGGVDEICNDNMTRQGCSSISNGSFDTKSCAERGYVKGPSGVWGKPK